MSFVPEQFGRFHTSRTKVILVADESETTHSCCWPKLKDFRIPSPNSSVQKNFQCKDHFVSTTVYVYFNVSIAFNLFSCHNELSWIEPGLGLKGPGLAVGLVINKQS